ncbi:unnamed protein product, partial [Ectocarpus sp. 8 AP-2014]
MASLPHVFLDCCAKSCRRASPVAACGSERHATAMLSALLVAINSHHLTHAHAHLLSLLRVDVCFCCAFITYRVGVPRGPIIVLACMSGCTRMHGVF